MTWATQKRLYELVCWRLRGYRGHPDWDDIVQEGLILAWQAYQRNSSRPEGERFALSIASSRWAYIHYLRRWLGREGKNGAREPIPTVPMEMAEEIAIDGFEDATIDRVDASRLLERWKSLCSPRQRQVVERVILHGDTFRRAGQQIGIHEKDAFDYYKTAVKKCRTAWGIQP